MSTMRIRVNKHVPTEDGPVPHLFARITKLGPDGRSIAEHLEDAWVPVSSDPQDAQSFSLPPGDYRVEVTMPSGDLLSESFRLADTVPHDVVLSPAPPMPSGSSTQKPIAQPRERIGLVPKAQYRSRHVKLSTGRPVRPAGASGGGMRMRGDPAFASASARRGTASVYENVGLRLIDGRVDVVAKPPQLPWASDRLAAVDVTRPLRWLGKGPAKYSFDVLRTDPWTTLPALRGATDNIIAVLNAGRPEMLLPPSVHDENAAVFSIDTAGDSDVGTFAPGERDYVMVERRTGGELVSLPTPWRDQWSARVSPIDVTVQRPTYESEFASGVSVGDPQLAFLLSFLQSGALPAAKRLAEHASEMLYEKGLNPLAAAAGGYALVSSAVSTRHERWYRWIENLMHRYQHLPDGAVLYATMRLRLRTSNADIDHAADAFKAAYRRGLPFYGMGMRWLLDGLERLSVRDEEAKEMAVRVGQLTARLHPSSAFTIIRLGRF